LKDNYYIFLMKLKKSESKSLFVVLIVVCIVLFLVVLVFVGILLFRKGKDETDISDMQQNLSVDVNESDSPAVKAGKKFSAGDCEGEGPVVLGTSPMKETDFSTLIPYGLMVGAHVTPIDHQYFDPMDRSLGRDSYEVYAMADGKIIDISWRESNDEYRLVFMHTCTFFTYFDLVTSLTPEIKAEFENQENNGYARVDIPVKEGQLIGFIGGQTLDFAVWDMTVNLDGFIVPEHYETEPWKIHTANPYDYYSPELKTLLIEKNIRTAAPIQGKIDYDIDGRLVGTWFEEGTNGYAGTQPKYYSTHLSVVYEHIDPTAIIVSLGDFEGEAEQFAVKGNKPDPSEVSVASGLTKYDLMDYEYATTDGSPWDRMSLVKDLRVVEAQGDHGCVLFQLIEERKLKVEIFPGDECGQIFGFSQNVKIYER